MNIKKPFGGFVQDSISFFEDFDPKNANHIKEIIRLALNYYELKSVIKFEEVNSEKVETIYIASMAEENMLTRIAELATGQEATVESVYEGYVVRKH